MKSKIITDPRTKLDAYLKAHLALPLRSATLTKVIGDQYLYETNWVYRGVRDEVLRLGYSFKENPPFRFQSYPLIYLSKILKTKTIPYIDNVTCLTDLEKSRPGKLIMFDLFHVRPTPNYLLHEAAHAVAHAAMDVSKLARRGLSAEKLKVTEVMIGESYANLIELMAIQLTRDSWLNGLNFYQGTQIPEFQKLLNSIGSVSTTKLMLGLFLYSNFLCDTLSKNEHQRIFEFAEVSKSSQKLPGVLDVFHQIEKTALDLSVDFRIHTSSLFLKCMGFDKNLMKLLDFDPVELLLQNSDLRGQVDELCRIVQPGVESLSRAQSPRGISSSNSPRSRDAR